MQGTAVAITQGCLVLGKKTGVILESEDCQARKVASTWTRKVVRTQAVFSLNDTGLCLSLSLSTDLLCLVLYG